MVHFVGAGPGAPDLITLRGAERLKKADVVIYAGSLVNPVLLGLCSAQCRIFNSAEMTLEQVLSTMEQAEREQKQTVRLHTGDPCLYGAIQEQMDALKKRGIPYTLTPGVSSFCGAAAAVYPAGHQSDCDHHPDGGPNPSPGAGEYCLFGRAWGDHGDFSVGLFAGRTAGGSASRGVYSADPGGSGV